ncbi:hypothetical protein TNCV_4225241 [Trichonephila clavipes]|uniref:Uncharacterized protein n=1 Tax=Trichonephila clavipes TaxID=2585209 RepID=A0A8X6VS58_TRICX|nr:hypothetical protein TNCV_4225241 [Trichonephila clavipes]
MNINVALFSHTRAFGDGPRNFESWSSDVDGTPSPYYHSKFVDVSALDRFSMHRSPTLWVFSSTGLGTRDKASYYPITRALGYRGLVLFGNGFNTVFLKL